MPLGVIDLGSERDKRMRTSRALITPAIVAAVLCSTRISYAHCDTLDGPVGQAARAALQAGDVATVLKWVGPNEEKEISEVFAKTLKARAAGADARDVADLHFFETLVRLHRAGEGVGYTGLKPAGEIENGIAAADEAIDHHELATEIAKAVAAGVRTRFAKVAQAEKHADENVQAGRVYVKAYVEYIHYVEAAHALASRASDDQHHIHAAQH
jgi:hypothetical protein